MVDPFVFESGTYHGKDLMRQIAGGAKVLRVDASGHGDFSDVQDAIDAAATGTVIVVSPGDHVGNFELHRGVDLLGLSGWGPGGRCKLTSASGVTLDMPHTGCTVQGLRIESTSAVATDAALHAEDDGGPAAVDGSFLVNFHVVASNGARALHVEGFPPDISLSMIYGGVDAAGGPTEAILCDDAGLYWLLGGGGSDSDFYRGVNGGLLFVGGGVGLSAEPTTGRVIDLDGGLFVALDTLMNQGGHGIRGLNGSVIFLMKAAGLGGFADPVETDAGSLLITGADVALEPIGGAPLAGWNVGGPWLRAMSTLQGIGTALGPDQRPPVCPPGYLFFATDTAVGGGPGGGCLLVWTGAAWVTTTGTVIP
jgi:hypothetical protein